MKRGKIIGCYKRDSSMQFVHLGIHTEFSITESIVRIPDLISAAAKDEMPALAITISLIYMPLSNFIISV